MRNLILVFIFALFASFQSCQKINCEDYACFTPPQPFYFELLDSVTHEDLFANGTLDSNQIEVFNIANNNKVDYKYIRADSNSAVVIYGIGWELERTQVEVTLRVSTKDILNLYLDSESISENCCTFTRYHEIRIENANYEMDKETGNYKIYIN
jgi:hypothetical protein